MGTVGKRASQRPWAGAAHRGGLLLFLCLLPILLHPSTAQSYSSGFPKIKETFWKFCYVTLVNSAIKLRAVRLTKKGRLI